MNNYAKIALSSLMALSLVACSGGKYKAGTYTGVAAGRNGDVKVEVTVSANKIESVKVVEQQETESIAAEALTTVPEAIVKNQSANVDTVSGATITSKAIIEAAKNALEQAGAKDDGSAKKHENVKVTYKEGTYTGTGTGYNGPINLTVTFTKDGISEIDYSDNKETNHIGTPAFDYLVADAKEANGAGIDVISGATFTSIGFKNALIDAAKQAEASDLDGFKKNTVEHKAGEAIEKTTDVVVVGAGGAGMATAVQSAQNGNSVVVLEVNAEIGGNTVASGGQFQSAQSYLVWDPADPDAPTGVYKGVTYNKVHNATGNIKVLKEILNWNEKEFDSKYFDNTPFVAGDIETLSHAGVHAEYLSTLKELKSEIQAYLNWAQPQLDAGKAEGEITLFSTPNLHIFQTYYGGLRPNAEKTSWIYGSYDLVKQFVDGGQDLKGWLENQGAIFDNSIQPIIVGALWNRENDFKGSDLDGDGTPDPDGKNVKGKTVWNTYFATTKKTLLETAANHADNEIMLRTKVTELITDKDGKVVGVKGVQYDGTPVTIHAKKGVVLATGGYAADIKRVMETNDYWADGDITTHTRTTNRSSLVGSGIDMGVAVGAETTGMGFAQMMPISWVDNGNLAFGGGHYAIYINPTTGKRFVNETGERDVLSLAEFENGVSFNGTNGTIMDIANSNQLVPGPYPYGTPKDEDLTLWESDVKDRQYTRTVDQLGELFKQLGFECTQEEVINTIKEYDMALMTGTENTLNPTKTGWTTLIGTAEKDENGKYIVDTYKLEGVKLKIRLLAPSTHHTMGGLAVDTQRHVLDKDGNIIKGLYAAGEVTGGIHGGNRLGGNAIVEIFVSGRTAADTIVADNK
ncbi:FAD-dependent oxidoreductase [Solobacterium moorei]|mgnify:FL=1|uniref:FAD-dependent oxidoreductase n=1 Tax=Solobacterium moorei TaxID=102148 RepID=UPI0028F05AD2|nr:FAD-dependent oxidoreductase [Solobacterium moorei]